MEIRKEAVGLGDYVERFDREALRPEAGVRAIWILYKRGAWGLLEDIGIDRNQTESIFRKFEDDHLVSERLTKAQVRTLLTIIPGLKGASTELRVNYALVYYEEKTA